MRKDLEYLTKKILTETKRVEDGITKVTKKKLNMNETNTGTSSGSNITANIYNDGNGNYSFKYSKPSLTSWVFGGAKIGKYDDLIGKKLRVVCVNTGSNPVTGAEFVLSTSYGWGSVPCKCNGRFNLAVSETKHFDIRATKSEISKNGDFLYMLLRHDSGTATVLNADCKVLFYIYVVNENDITGDTVYPINALDYSDPEYAKTSGISTNAFHTTAGMNIVTSWFVNGQYNVSDFSLKDGIYQFIFNKDSETPPSNWWLTILTANLGKVNTLSGKKLVISIKQKMGDDYCKIDKVCISSKNGNWSTAFDIAQPTSKTEEEYIVNLDEVIASGKVGTADTDSLYLMLGANKGGSTDPKMNQYNFSWSVSAAICEKENTNSTINFANFVGNTTATKIEDIVDYVEQLQATLGNNYIACWGDSLTAGGGWTTRLGTLSGLKVYNGGTGGELSTTIMARQGADAMMVDDLTIPADTTAVTIATKATDGGIKTFEGKVVAPLLQGGTNHVNPVKIGDVEGTLKWTGSSYSDSTGTWTFTRSEAGNEVVIKRPTAITTKYDREYNNPYLMVIYIGQNGGYDDDLDTLVRQHRLMIEHANAKHVIVLGLSSGTAAGRKAYEERMQKEFGRYFISLRQYLAHPIYGSDGSTIVNCYGLADQNLTPTSSDLTEIAQGKVPQQLLADSVHYTDGTKRVIGDLIYKCCKELNIFK